MASRTNRRSFFKQSGILAASAFAAPMILPSRVFGPNDPKDIGPNTDVPPELNDDLWLGPAPDRPDNSKRVHDNFRFWWDDSGGQITNFGAHHLDIVWFPLFGRGIVDSLDDIRESHPPSHPELLDVLAHDFAAQGFHLKPLIRSIMNSATDQLASDTNETSVTDEANFSHAIPRRLGAEQLLDAFGQSLGTTSKFAGFPEGTRALQIAGVRAVRTRDEAASASDKFHTVWQAAAVAVLRLRANRFLDAGAGVSADLGRVDTTPADRSEQPHREVHRPENRPQ